MANCPCGLDKSYTRCCARFINGKAIPATPEELMRSRYVAFTKANIEYIKKTMRPPASLDFDEEGAQAWSARVKWLGLEIVHSSMDGNKGEVEFRALFADGDEHRLMHELSIFTKGEDNKWYYVDGEQPQKTIRVNRVGRNDPCLCGSGKKSKKCCAG